MEEKDLYKIIGTSRRAVEITIEGKARSEKEQNLFIKEKVEHTIKLLEIKKNSPMRSEEERRRIEKQIEEVKHAYNKLRTIDLRNTYNAILDSQVAELKPKLPLQRDAYKILLTSRVVCSDSGRKDIDIDNMLWEQKEKLIHFAQRGMAGANFSKKQKIELEIRDIEEAYEQIKDRESREKYNMRLDKIKEKRMREIQEEQEKRKYDCSMKYDESILDKNAPPCHKTHTKNVFFHELQDKNGEVIRIAETGRINYTNFTSVYKANVDEYLVRRMINGEEKQDYIYGNISMFDLSIDKHTGKPINPEYYDLIVNEVLSRESIRACVKYNHGYIGEIEKTKQGYERAFNNRERISAVMKVYGESDARHKKANQELGG